MANAIQLLQLLKASLSIEECKERYQKHFKPFIISCIDSKERIKLLKEYFKLEVSSTGYPGEYDASEIVLDLLEQALSFAVSRGLPYQEICFFLSFYVSCLDSVAGNSDDDNAPSLLTTIQHFQDKIVPIYSRHLSSLYLQYSIEYITKSIFQHFHLYQFLLTRPQNTQLTSLHLGVETPTIASEEVAGLHEAVAEDVWLKIKKWEELEAEYDKQIKQLESKQAEAQSLADANLEKAYKTQLAMFSDGPKKVSLEQLSVIINTLTKAHVESALVGVSQGVLDKQNVDLNFRLEQLESVTPEQYKEMRSHYSVNSSRNDPSRTSGSTAA